MSQNYTELEQTYTRVKAALSSIADKKTVEDLGKIAVVIAEVRLAQQSITEGDVSMSEVTERLMNSLFDVKSPE